MSNQGTMTEAWLLQDGAWTPKAFDWPDGKTLQDIGLLRLDHVGDDCIVDAALHGRREGSQFPWRWLIEYCPDASQSLFFAADDPPSMVEAWSRVLGCVAQRDALETIGPAARKLFRVQHGHDLDAVCHDCDPVEAEQIARTRAASQARRVASFCAAGEPKADK